MLYTYYAGKDRIRVRVSILAFFAVGLCAYVLIVWTCPASGASLTPDQEIFATQLRNGDFFFRKLIQGLSLDKLRSLMT